MRYWCCELVSIDFEKEKNQLWYLVYHPFEVTIIQRLSYL